MCVSGLFDLVMYHIVCNAFITDISFAEVS